MVPLNSEKDKLGEGSPGKIHSLHFWIFSVCKEVFAKDTEWQQPFTFDMRFVFSPYSRAHSSRMHTQGFKLDLTCVYNDKLTSLQSRGQLMYPLKHLKKLS